MHPRAPGRLDATEFDLLIVGGGIYGLACAYEGASRGLSVALVEAGDFGGGASGNHQKTAHGGLRSLASGDLSKARESIRERRALARIAPWFLRPLPFLVGTYRSVSRSRLALRAAFRLDAWLARDRNAGVEPGLHLPAPRLLSAAAARQLFPGIRLEGLTGGAQWYDYQMVESDRLTAAFAEAAGRAGAVLVNHAAAVAALKPRGAIAGMRVRDTLGGDEIDVRARLTLNAAGAAAGEVMALFGVARPLPLLRAINFVTSKPARDVALAAPGPGGRMLTLVPWHGRALVGTGQSSSLVAPGDTAVTEAEIAGFITEVNHAFPALALERPDVTLVHRGCVPAAAGRANLPDLKPAPEIIDHAADGAPGALTVIGVKYTTARGVAERTIEAAAARLGRRLPASRTAVAVLPGAGIADHEAPAIEATRAAGIELPAGTLARLVRLYADAAPAIVGLMAAQPELAAPLGAGSDAVGAEVLHVVRHEMAVRLADIVVRRTSLGAAGRPPDDVLAACARLAAAELQWTPGRIAEERALVERVYAVEG